MSKMKDQSILAYVVCDSDRKVEDEISDGCFFDSKEAALKWIEENDAEKEYAYDIYSVDVRLVKSL